MQCGGGTCTAAADEIYICLCTDGSYKVNTACPCPEVQQDGIWIVNYFQKVYKSRITYIDNIYQIH